MKVMSEKQKKCIKWICDMLDIKYEGSESSYDAWRFIKENKKAADEVALGEKEADEFILGLMAQVRYPKYHVSYDNGKKNFMMSLMASIWIKITLMEYVQMEFIVQMISKNLAGCLPYIITDVCKI